MTMWLELMLLRAATLAAQLWEGMRWLSILLRPYAEVIKPINDLGGFTIAVVVALYQFLSKRKLKLKLERVERAVSDGEDEPWLLYNPQPYKERRGFRHKPSSQERDTKYS